MLLLARWMENMSDESLAADDDDDDDDDDEDDGVACYPVWYGAM